MGDMESQEKTAQFRASSGRHVTVYTDGAVAFEGLLGYVGSSVVGDAEEFFRAREDARLGRWRWPENPEWVAVEADRTDEGRTVVVVNERTLTRFHANERVRDAGPDATADRRAARAYFEAHPERKPWEDAKPGEVWAVGVDGEEVFTVSVVQDVFGVSFRLPTGRAFDLNESSTIKSGRRIWPEDAS